MGKTKAVFRGNRKKIFVMSQPDKTETTGAVAAANLSEDSSFDDSSGKLECAICLQSCIHPVLLPCTHIFCYLCVKGVANQSKRCAMCRQVIPADFLDNPHLVPAEEVDPDITFEDGYQWFYEGRNGWWQYDERTSVEIESAYKKGDKRCEVLIAGFLYIIDFEHMIQVRRCDPSRRRHIKRDLASVPKKGVAGIRTQPVETSYSTVEDCDNAQSTDIEQYSKDKSHDKNTQGETSKEVLDNPLDNSKTSTISSSSGLEDQNESSDHLDDANATTSNYRSSAENFDRALSQVVHNLRLADDPDRRRQPRRSARICSRTRTLEPQRSNSDEEV